MGSSSSISSPNRAELSPLKCSRSLTCLSWLRKRTIYCRLYRGYQSWPFNLIAKCENAPEGEKLGKYLPRSDLLVLKSFFPRLLMEVNSKPKQEWPEDLVRMLLCGAAVVRLANKFLHSFMRLRISILFAIYLGRWNSNPLFTVPGAE